MFVNDQEKKILGNFEYFEVEHYQGSGYEDYVIRSNGVFLGHYPTEKLAKKVLNDMVHWLNNTTVLAVHNVSNIGYVYIMPSVSEAKKIVEKI